MNAVWERLVHLRLSRGHVFGGLILTALLFFEVFNYSTTDFALHDLLGEMRFAGLRWSTILAVAFCGIDFAGIARLFTPEEDGTPTETWYLFGAWLLAATMNAMLTWWGVSVALLSHLPAGAQVVDPQTTLRFVPVFVAVLVWLVRVLIIGTIASAGPRLFSTAPEAPRRAPKRVVHRPLASAPGRTNTPLAARPRPQPVEEEPRYEPTPEPTYEPMYAAGREPASPNRTATPRRSARF